MDCSLRMEATPMSGHRVLGGGCHAWLQPGGWGLSNAGLVTGKGAALLVDTLFDVRLTRRMLAGFAGVTASAGSPPILWAGPIGNWLKACRLLLDLDVETIVPGHGPVAGKETVRETEAYFEFLLEQASSRFAAGMPAADAAADIGL